MTTYQWQDDTSGPYADIMGETNQTYVTTPGEVGFNVRVIATVGMDTLTSDPVAIVDTGGSSDGLFLDDSPWYTPIGGSPSYRSDQATIIGGQETINFYLALDSYSAPRYEAASGDPSQTVSWSGAGGSGSTSIRVNPNARPAPGTDGHLILIDRTAGKMLDLYKAMGPVGGPFTASYGYLWTIPAHGIILDDPGAGVRASGIAGSIGCLTQDEINGVVPINHALAFAGAHQSRKFLPESAGGGAAFASGRDTSAQAVHCGTRWQLDPGLDLSGYTAQWQRIGTALQDYGMIYVDGSPNLSLFGCAPIGVYGSGQSVPFPVSSLKVIDYDDGDLVTA